ncbi:MAG TPA: BON domain-containing protein [Bryobacteraceae bacterium]|nr:BON domain-containing protein [Bryobacteraceae bacterium]
MHRVQACTVVLLLALAAWSDPGSTGTRARTAAKSALPARSDADIERDIRSRLAKSKISEDNFQVHVQGGIATLEGNTGVIQHKGVATRLAKSGGAVAVVNKIQISEAAKAKAAKNLETGRRRAQIKRSEGRSEATPARPNR